MGKRAAETAAAVLAAKAPASEATTDLDTLAFSAETVAERLEISRAKVYELFARGELPVVRIDGSTRVPAAALARWLAERTLIGEAAKPDPTRSAQASVNAAGRGR